MENNNQLPKTRKEQAVLYDVNVKTLKKWLKNAGLEFTGCNLTPKEVLKIYEKLGYPKGIETPENDSSNHDPEKEKYHAVKSHSAENSNNLDPENENN